MSTTPHSGHQAAAARLRSAATRTEVFRGSGGLAIAGDLTGPEDGPTVVLLHGGGQTRHSWRAAAEELAARGFFAVRLDARGHGDSAWDAAGRYGLDAMVADLDAVLAVLPAPAVLVGASMGGATALCCTSNDGGRRVAALVMVDVVPRIELAGARRIAAFMRAHLNGFATLDAAADAVAEYNSHRARPGDPSGLRANLRERADGRLYWHWDPRVLDGADPIRPDLIGGALQVAARAISVPTLLVRGLHSDVVSDAGIAEFRAAVPQLEVVDVARAGHMVAGDRNDAFNAGVIEFLVRHHPPR